MDIVTAHYIFYSIAFYTRDFFSATLDSLYTCIWNFCTAYEIHICLVYIAQIERKYFVLQSADTRKCKEQSKPYMCECYFM